MLRCATVTNLTPYWGQRPIRAAAEEAQLEGDGRMITTARRLRELAVNHIEFIVNAWHP